MEPLVSIVCTTYNHEKYIGEAIESFLMQETNFPFEIIIHDDASTDRTPEIIREYENKYPDIIRPVYQKENQFSKGIRGNRITIKFLSSLIQGKYVATCEGDDYWTDKNKLQKQVDFLEKNKDYIACFHKVKMVDREGNFTEQYLEPNEFISRDYTIKDIVKGGYMHVSSRMYRSAFYKREEPSWVTMATQGDNFSALYAVLEGKVFFLGEAMSAYRVGVENSIMTNIKTKYTKEQLIANYVDMLKAYELANEHYDYKYEEDINKIITNVCVTIAGIIVDPNKNAQKTTEELMELIPTRYRDKIRDSYTKGEQKNNYIRFVEDFKKGLYDAKILEYFGSGIKREFIVYGAGTLGMLLKERLEGTNSEIRFFVEDRPFSDPGRNILNLNDIDKAIINNADELIVTPFYDYENIKKLLLYRDIKIPIYSLEEILK